MIYFGYCVDNYGCDSCVKLINSSQQSAVDELMKQFTESV